MPYTWTLTTACVYEPENSSGEKDISKTTVSTNISAQSGNDFYYDLTE